MLCPINTTVDYPPQARGCDVDEFFMWLHELHQSGDLTIEELDEAITDKHLAFVWLLDCWTNDFVKTSELAQLELKRFKKHIQKNYG